ncbi:MAG: hypothetical protein OEV42_03595 [Deltaproteobacteria bacterium]|nr:hypothetical protein [Deltaproteobacteria bacterium]
MDKNFVSRRGAGSAEEGQELSYFSLTAKDKVCKRKAALQLGLRLPSLHCYLWRVYKLASLRQYKPFFHREQLPSAAFDGKKSEQSKGISSVFGFFC